MSTTFDRPGFRRSWSVDRFRPVRKPETEFLAVVTSFEEVKSGHGNLMWVFGVTLRDDASASYPVYCTFREETAWWFRQFLMGCAVEVPRGSDPHREINPNHLVGKTLGIALEDDEKDTSAVACFFPAPEFDGPR
ncbi:hypothetical protein ACQEV4_40225 [Streptomyces shenzhenensis]|uniref:hypothetical protein n=1 Tax=Streptomyces shenzhenensis TaxID=943815 RepID=UPI003D932152